MGWLKPSRPKATVPTWGSNIVTVPAQANEEAAREHIEDAGPPNGQIRSPGNESFQSIEDLPFLPAYEVRMSAETAKLDSEGNFDNTSGKLLLVVDQIVYDCTEFVYEHPGGDAVIQSFAGKDCSWQFWRFHNKQIMEEWGGPLRVGRTEGVENPHKERPRFVGLRKLGDDWWD